MRDSEQLVFTIVLDPAISILGQKTTMTISGLAVESVEGKEI